MVLEIIRQLEPILLLPFLFLLVMFIAASSTYEAMFEGENPIKIMIEWLNDIVNWLKSG